MTTTRFRRGNRGYVLFTGSALAIGLVCFTGLAFDTGYAQLQRSRIQTAADAAVVGAVAQSSRATGTNAMVVAARQNAAYNGFTHGQNGVAVNLNYPPTSGRYANNNSWIEARVTQAVPTFFMRMVGTDTINISARAVAKAGGPGDGCVFVLHPTMGGAFDLNGNGTLDSCGIHVNSNNLYAANINGNYTMKLSSFRIVGGYWIVSGGAQTWMPGSFPVTGSNPITDPLWHKVAPDASGPCRETNLQLKGGGTKVYNAQPGVYCGGISVSSGWRLNLAPGLYVLRGGGLDVATNGEIVGDGVTIYNTYAPGYAYAPITINGNNVSKLSAPTSGPQEAMLIFQDRTAPAGVANYIKGSSNFTLDGAVYFPTQAFELNGSSSLKYTIVVANSLEISGGTTLKADYSGLTNGNPMLSKSFVFGE